MASDFVGKSNKAFDQIANEATSFEQMRETRCQDVPVGRIRFISSPAFSPLPVRQANRAVKDATHRTLAACTAPQRRRRTPCSQGQRRTVRLLPWKQTRHAASRSSGGIACQASLAEPRRKF